MVELNAPSEQTLDDIFKALSDHTRRQMLHRLKQEPLTVGELAAPHAMSLAAASKHVRMLERANLIRREVRGRQHVCYLNPPALADAHRWLMYYQRFWMDRLDALDSLLTKKGETNE